MVYQLLQRLNLRLCNIMHCIMYCYRSFLEQIRKMKRDNQSGTTVFHPETCDTKIEGDKMSLFVGKPSICVINVTKYVNYTRMVRLSSA